MPDTSGNSNSNGGGGGGTGGQPASPPAPVLVGGMSIVDLAALITTTLATVSRANQAAGAANPVLGAQPPPAPVIPSQTIAPAGTSGLSIPDQFPQFEESVLHEIAAHTFSPRDLWKLDERYAHSADRKRLFDLETGKFADSSAPKSYPSISFLLIPLESYFSIVTAYLAANNTGSAVAYVQRCFQEFRVDLIRLNDDYAWPAIVNYFTAFFLQRRAEMRAGKYDGWSQIDTVLQNRHLVGHPRSTSSGFSAMSSTKTKAASAAADRGSEICFAYNSDKGCSNGAARCRDGRIHGCRKCDEMGVRPAPPHSMRTAACPYYQIPIAPGSAPAR